MFSIWDQCSFKKVLVTLICLSTGISTIVGAQEITDSSSITLAVLDFQNNSSVFALDALEKSVPEMLKTELSHSADIIVVERTKLEDILAEQALSQAGIINSETAQEVGRMAGAQYIITGEISTTGERLRIDSHIIKVETGQVVGEKVIGKDKSVINEMVRLLAANIVYDLTGVGQRKEKMRISTYPTKWILLTGSATALASAITHFSYKNYYDEYLSAEKLKDFDANYDKANQYHKARNILLLTSGALMIATFISWSKERASQNEILAQRTDRKNPWSKRFQLALDSNENEFRIFLCVKL